MVTFDKGFAVENDRMTIVGSGQIDLKIEELDVGIRPEARQGAGIHAGQLAKLVRVTGKLSDPKLTADYKGLAKAYLTITTALATGGLSYLAQNLYSSATMDKTPCLTALGQKPKEAKAAAASSGSKSAEAEKTTEKPDGTAKKLFKDIKGIFGGKSDK